MSVAELARDHDVSAITVHRDLAELVRRGSDRASARWRAPGRRRLGRAHRDRLGEARAPGRRRQGRDRGTGRPPGGRQRHDLHRRLVHRACAGPCAGRDPARPAHRGHQLAGHSLRDHRGPSARDRGAGRGGPAHAADRGSLGHRVPGRPAHGRGLLVRRRGDARPGAHDLAPAAGRRGQRRARDGRAQRRPGRLVQVRTSLVAHDLPPRGARSADLDTGLPAYDRRALPSAGVSIEVADEIVPAT